MANSIVVAAADKARLDDSPIVSDWILAGSPQARGTELAKSHDGQSRVVAWECTAGEFVWHYDEDETIVVLSGEAFVTNDAGEELRIGQGDVVFFPAGSSSRWRVTGRIKKVAMLRKDLPAPFALGLRAWRKILRRVGLRTGSSPTPWGALAAGSSPSQG